ncbi:disease resistance protein RGA2-like [Panicum miliaceum]|uniref:Disease resistance protein RGA2-like n=1 Tax=Panicum miliaceum TaxID=4540 RepID=A0A3L6PST1_PANMI|nr:disease resistance protein RGA2-like [Panicum miliaceum]
MEVVAVSAARWTLGTVTDGFLVAWAASAGLGPNVDALKMELLYAQGMLDNAQGREIRSPALKELLLKLQQLAYGAADVLDELEYFRIQDALYGTYHAVDIQHVGGCVQGLVVNVRHTARAVTSKLKLSSRSREASRGDPDDDAKQGCLSAICSCGRRAISSAAPKSPNIQSDQNAGCTTKVASSSRRAAHNVGKRLRCCSFPCVHNNARPDMPEEREFCSACRSKIKEGKHVLQTPELKFDRVEISKKMKDIVEKLKPVSAKPPERGIAESIHSSNVRSIKIPTSTCHLSIIIDDKEVENILNFENFKKELRELDKRLNVENLRTLMLFGSHHGSYAKIFGYLFREARALCAIYLSGASYNVEDMLHNFSKLVHLRYLRIKSVHNKDICLPTALSRLYHLEVIDIQEWEGCSGFTRHMSNLVKLRHFLVPEYKLQLHSDIVKVGKMKLLQELRRFEVGKESKGFNLSQLGQLPELGGSLSICSLQRIQEMKEADEATLVQIKYLHKLTLEWDANRPEKDIVFEENALDILMPHSNLQHLCIRRHGGTKCPKWLGEKLSVKNLESLHLNGVAWNIFPPIGELRLVDGPHEEISSNICHKRENYKSEYSLSIKGKFANALDNTFWNLLAFDNSSELKELEINRCPPVPLHHFHMLSSLKTLELRNSSSIIFPLVEGESCADYQFPVECMDICEWGASAKELTQLLAYSPNLSELTLSDCDKILWLGVVEKQKQAMATPVQSSSANKAARCTN